jgi:hypothetical protein
LCADSQKHPSRKIARHENSAFHQTLIDESARHECKITKRIKTVQPTSSALPPFLGIIDDGTRNLLKSLAASSSGMWADGSTDDHRSQTPDPIGSLLPIEGWGLFEAHGETDLATSLEQQGITLIAQSLLDWFDKMSIDSEDNNEEQSEVDEAETPEPILPG